MPGAPFSLCAERAGPGISGRLGMRNIVPILDGKPRWLVRCFWRLFGWRYWEINGRELWVR